MDDLQTRVEQFNALELPGQPLSMHLGTSFLVFDLWREVRSLRDLLANCNEARDTVKKMHNAAIHTIVSTIGGEVEGRPTASINYLQRLRELVELEARIDREKYGPINMVPGL